MTPEEKRDQAVQMIAELLQTTPFELQFKVVKKPKGIRIIYELTQEEMNALVKMQQSKTEDWPMEIFDLPQKDQMSKDEIEILDKNSMSISW